MGKFVGGSEYLTECPHCNKQKLYYNTVKQVGWCHTCERVFFERDGIFVDSGVEPVRGTRLPAGVSQLAWMHPEARTYLEGRNVTGLQAVTVGIEYFPEAKTIRIPITAPSPEFPTAWMKRRIDGPGWYYEGGPDKKPYSFGHEAIAKTGRRSCVLVEGCFDVLSPDFTGYALALLGTRLYDLTLVWLEENTDFVGIWLDPGEKELEKAKYIKRELDNVGIRNLILQFKQEPGDCKRDDPRVEYVKKLLELGGKREVPSNR